MKFHCSSSLCFNNYLSKDQDGNKLKFYRLPRQPDIQRKYEKMFKTTGMNFKNGFICSAHWKDGVRKGTDDLPNIIVPEPQLAKLKLRYSRAKKKLDAATDPSIKMKLAYKNSKQKLNAALEISKHSPVKKNTRRVLIKSTTPRIKRNLNRRLNCKRKLASTEDLTKEIIEVNCTVREMEGEIEILKTSLSKLQQKITTLESENADINRNLQSVQQKLFTYDNIKQFPQRFKYLCGLEITKFNLVMEIIQPYVHLVPYGDCKPSAKNKTVDVATQFLTVLVICRHGIDIRFMAYILEKSETTVQRIFNAWVIFLATLFNRIDLKPSHGYLLQKMPKSFIETGHGLTDIVIDATEFKFQHASNFELNSLMFSNYKNTVTGKALIGISPHGMGLFFSDIYPGSISDSEITEKTGILEFVQEEHEVMSDKGFSIQELCASKGVTLNRPKQKNNPQFSEAEIQDNFNIASTRIHVERFIGRVRDWTILNNVWPLNKMDLLSSTWIMLCHIVNITMHPIGPKE